MRCSSFEYSKKFGVKPTWYYWFWLCVVHVLECHHHIFLLVQESDGVDTFVAVKQIYCSGSERSLNYKSGDERKQPLRRNVIWLHLCQDIWSTNAAFIYLSLKTFICFSNYFDSITIRREYCLFFFQTVLQLPCWKGVEKSRQNVPKIWFKLVRFIILQPSHYRFSKKKCQNLD